MADRKINKSKSNINAKHKVTHNNEKMISNENNDNILQGELLNNKTYEFACDDCLEKVMANGDMFCANDEPLSNTGRCNCGNLTTCKAIIL